MQKMTDWGPSIDVNVKVCTFTCYFFLTGKMQFVYTVNPVYHLGHHSVLIILVSG